MGGAQKGRGHVLGAQNQPEGSHTERKSDATLINLAHLKRNILVKVLAKENQLTKPTTRCAA